MRACSHGLERSQPQDGLTKLTTSQITVQSTKPQTIGYGLTDSPVALLAWIYEKLVDWTDEYPWTEDEVCTWISIYWFSTAGPRAAHQLYYETVHVKDNKNASTLPQLMEWQDVKVGLSHFPKDVLILPASWAHVIGNVVLNKYHEKGGHFAAWECPDLLVRDLRDLFTGGAKGAVKTT